MSVASERGVEGASDSTVGAGCRVRVAIPSSVAQSGKASVPVTVSKSIAPRA